jgi:hypothetical protein
MFGSNEGGTVNLNVSPSLTPGIFTAGSILFRNPATFPALPVPADTSKYPFTPLAGSAGGANDFDEHLKAGYTQSFSFGIQRELNKDTAVEVRWVRTRGTHLWRQYDLNEVNIFENGFLAQFNIAKNNLLLSRAAGKGDNYGFQATVPGTVAVPLVTFGLNSSTNSTMVTRLLQGQAGAAANTIAFNLSNVNRLIINGTLANGSPCTIATAGCTPFIPFTTLPLSTGCDNSVTTSQTCRVSNFFILNPQTAGGAFLMTQGTDTNFNALQIELRRRLSKGLLVQGSYQFGKALSNAFVSSSSVFSQPRTLRNPGLDRTYSPWDIRHAFKLDYIYELPFGKGKTWLSSSNQLVNKVVGNWQIGGVTRIQSGPATSITSGRATVNQNDAGVVLHNITRQQLQGLVKIRKEPNGIVYWLPQNIIDNTVAAFASPTGTPADPNAPWIGPPLTAGVLGDRLVLFGPWTARFDFNIVKRIPIGERFNLEGRVSFLNAFNRANFYIGDADSTIRSASAGSSTFGQTRSAYRDITVSGTNDPGGRLIEWQIRLNF